MISFSRFQSLCWQLKLCIQTLNCGEAKPEFVSDTNLWRPDTVRVKVNDIDEAISVIDYSGGPESFCDRHMNGRLLTVITVIRTCNYSLA